MSNAISAASGVGAGRWLDVGAQPLQQLSHLGGERWQSLGNDPQLLLTWPPGITAGPYRITVRLAHDAASGPVLYLDTGSGWSESSCFALERQSDGCRWTLLAWLPDAAPPARLDPVDHEGEFAFSGVTVERLGEAEALLVSLARGVDADPAAAAALVHEAHRCAIDHGIERCWAALGLRGATATDAPMSYDAWIRAYDTLSVKQEVTLRSRVALLPRRPLISLLLPVADLHANDVRACIDAVLVQLYPDWGLCLAVDGDRRQDLLPVLSEYVARSSRVRLDLRGDDESATGQLRRLADGLEGEFVGVLDGGPVLARHTLLAYVEAIVDHSGVGILYADTDRIESGGRRVDPYFKPAWNPELFVLQDYLNPFALYAANIVRAVGGLRGDDEAALVSDLAQRCVAALAPGQVLHVPLVLCHARGDVVGIRSKEAPSAPAVHLGDSGSEGMPGSGVNLRGAGPPLPQPPPKVSLIVPTRDRVDLLRQCVESLRVSTYPSFEIVIVDNQSTEPETLEYLAEVAARGNVRVLAYDAPFNYSAINNFAVEHVDGEIVGLINNDIEAISPDWIEQMVRYAARPDVGAVGAMLYYPDDTIQHAGVVVGLGGVAGHAYAGLRRGTSGQHGRAAQAQSLTAVTAACLLVRREVYRDAGGLDEGLAVAFNDVDFCLRLVERGYRNVWTPLADLYHHESASRGIEDTPEKQSRFRAEVEIMLRRWGHRLDWDAAYHPALSLESGRASQLANPPRFSLVDLVDACASVRSDAGESGARERFSASRGFRIARGAMPGTFTRVDDGVEG